MPLTGEYVPNKEEWARNQADVFEATDGREENTLRGRPIILLTSLGAKTGYLRKNPLMRVEHDGSYAVIASKGGAPTHPTWYYNLIEHPLVDLQDGAEKHSYIARELPVGPERDEWWARAVETWPDYATYQTKTDRLIPVFLLTRAAED